MMNEVLLDEVLVLKMKVFFGLASFSRLPGEGLRMRYLPNDEVCDARVAK
jgi:hypothetical protein